MDVVSKEILAPSKVYFYTCSALAREIFFYPLCTGHFYCDKGYEVNRGRYDSFLLIYTAAGKGYVYNGSQRLEVVAGEFVLMDCYQPQRYGTDDNWEIYWLHFDGKLARQYCELCTQNGPILRPDDGKMCARQLQSIFESFGETGSVNEAEVSRRITNFLTAFMQPQGWAKGQSKAEDVVDETLSYITNNMDKSLPLEELARNVAMSPFYFSRLFKRETGYSPHEYIVRARVDKAKYLLKFTSMPLKEIARCCGFSNECNFSTSFKKISGSTPRSFREGRV